MNSSLSGACWHYNVLLLLLSLPLFVLHSRALSIFHKGNQVWRRHAGMGVHALERRSRSEIVNVRAVCNKREHLEQSSEWMALDSKEGRPKGDCMPESE